LRTQTTLSNVAIGEAIGVGESTAWADLNLRRESAPIDDAAAAMAVGDKCVPAENPHTLAPAGTTSPPAATSRQAATEGLAIRRLAGDLKSGLVGLDHLIKSKMLTFDPTVRNPEFLRVLTKLFL
jgi:hypothetical protein